MIVIPLLWLVPAMLLGGRAYTHDVIVKQTVGRAVASWVHNAPPWFYVIHLPASLFPWFFLAVAAVIALWRTQRFLVNWILAVLVPYSVMSSKLDVYMMAMIPPVALLIAEYVPRERGRLARSCNAMSHCPHGADRNRRPFRHSANDQRSRRRARPTSGGENLLRHHVAAA